MSEYPLRLSEGELARYRYMAEAALRTEGDMWQAAGVVEGARVADIGCGPGAVSAVLARLVGPAGHVWAVDRDGEALEAAAAATATAEGAVVTVTTGDAHDTGLAPGSVDTVMIRHVLAHNGGREQAIVDHAASLVRPGGCVYLADIDATAMRVRPPVPELEELDVRYGQWHAQRGNDLSVGLRLAELLGAAGLEVIDFQGRFQIIDPPPGMRGPSWAARDALVEAGLATSDDVARWQAAFDRVDRMTERPTLFVALFFATGRRPT